MSKELTPLEAFKYIKQDLNYFQPKDLVCTNRKEQYYIIETALKEKEKQDDVIKVIKDIIAFGKVLPHIEPNKENGFDIMSAVSINVQRDIENRERELLRQWVLETCFPKELKALEIIKKFPAVASFMMWALYNERVEKHTYSHIVQYCEQNDKEIPTQEEFDLLKEVVKEYDVI